MTLRNLGLFDTPSDRRQVQLCLLVIGLLAIATLAIYPFRNESPGELVAVVLLSDVILLLFDLLTATMLLNQAYIYRSRALMVLGAAFVLGGLLDIPHSLTFPGLFTPTGLLGAGTNSTAWIAAIERMIFPAAIIAYVVVRHLDGELEPASPRRPPPIGEAIAVAIVIAFLVTVVTTTKQAWLPPYFRNRTELANVSPMGLGIFGYVLILASLVALIRERKSMLDLWLLVALAGQTIQGALVVTLHARFTVGWYALFALSVASRLAVTIALLSESIRHHTNLVLATATQARERDTRLMSMDAVAGAISHELGQPLSAAMLGLTSARKWLAAPQPQPERARASLDEALGAAKEAFDVVRSTRALFATGPGVTTECDVNELLRSASTSLAREMAARGISLHLKLRNELPMVVANPVQLQRVLVNLLTNAMESVQDTRNGRRIVAQTGLSTNDLVQIEVSDNGKGVGEGLEKRIFDPFFSTKANGTGLGLSLCRTIVEEHSGRIWVTDNEEGGATFHVHLPCIGGAPLSQPA